MSIRVMTWVWESSAAKGLDRLILLAIADNADDQGGNAWPSVDTLGKKAQVSERTVQRSIRRLVELGELTVAPGAGRNGVNVYRVLTSPRPVVTPLESHPAQQSPPGGVTESAGGVSQSLAPRPPDTQTVLEPSLTQQSPNARGSRGTRLPDNWRPSDLTRTWTLGHVDQAAAGRELEKFRNYWTAKAGQAARKVDWEATWRNWILNSGATKTRSTTNDRVAAALELAAKYEAEESTHA